MFTMKGLVLIPSLLLTASALHIGLVCPGHAGHLNPTATLGAELQRRGNQVTIVTTPTGYSTAKKHGLAFKPIGITEYESGALRLDLAQEGRLRGLSAFWHTIQLFKREEHILLRDLPAVIRELRFDALCVDQLLPAAMDVADVHGIPFGVLCNALPLHLDPDVPPFVTGWAPSNGGCLRRLRNKAVNIGIILVASPLYIILNQYRAKHGLAKHKGSTAQNVGKIQLTQIPSFVDFPRTKLPDHFFYSKPWHENTRDATMPFPWERLDGRPIVYASLGSVQTGLHQLYMTIAEACSSLDIQLVMSLGRKGASLPDHLLPPNAVVVDFAPQLQLLQLASAVLTHGGLNTALEALACGLPTVVVPLCNDQPGIAARLANLGVAQVVPVGRVKSEVLREAIVKALEDPKYRLTASLYKQRMHNECPTLAQTAELIETAVCRTTPLHRDDPEVERILGITPVSNMTMGELEVIY
jgi:zeaxanthin glucosyltransferase